MTSPLGQFLDSALSGVERGYAFRTGIEDRKRRIASENDAAQYEQARRLREGVAFELQQRVANAQLENIAADNARADQAQALEAYKVMNPKPEKPLVQDWQREGFTSQAAWQAYHKQISRAGQGGAAAPNEAAQKVALGRVNAISALRQAEALLAADPSADVRSVASAGAEGLSNLPLVGKALHGFTGAAQQKLLTPNQQKFQRLMDAFSHNAVGLLPGSRQSLTIFQNLRDTYTPAAGASPEARAEQRKLRRELMQRLEQAQSGQEITEGDLFIPAAEEPAAPPSPPTSIGKPVTPTRKRVDPSRFYTP